ncbi:MAG: DNA polymerase III subunit beta [Erysipelotrichaceae bacterium]|jgi:DNA polymerase-3 subunit beta|nr:DNA polymerase III subunit beta [Erysipelotrichaceae bacterium]
MKFTIVREELLKGLNIAARAVASKSPIPIFNNLKIELNETGLFITGSNNDVTILTMIPYSKDGKEIIRNYKEGATLINAKILTEIIRKVDSPEMTIDVVDSTVALISGNRSEFKLNCIRAEEYPDVDIQGVGSTLSLSRDEFSTLVNQTAFAASLKEQRPILMALNLEASAGKLTATATDSARMARKTIDIDSNINFVTNIPAKMMIEIIHISEGVDKISLTVSDKRAVFSFARTTVSTRLLSGDYPNTKNIVPRTLNYVLQVNAADLVKAIERVSLLSIERENVVNLSMGKNKIEVSSKSSQIGSASEKIEMFHYEGGDLEVGFNNEFVLSAIRALGSTDVTLAFVGEMKPFVVRNDLDDSVIQVVTPVRMF